MAPSGTWFLLGASAIRKCVDGIYSDMSPIPSSSAMRCIWGLSPSAIWVGSGVTAGENGKIFYFNGTSWSEQLDLGSNDWCIVDILGTSATNVYAVANQASASNCRIYHFDGATWTLEETHVDCNANGIYIESSGRVYVSLSKPFYTPRIYLRYKNSGGSWTNDGGAFWAASDYGIHFIVGTGIAGETCIGISNSAASSGRIYKGQAESWALVHSTVSDYEPYDPTGTYGRGWQSNGWCDPVTGQVFAVGYRQSTSHWYCIRYDGSTWNWDDLTAINAIYGISSSKVGAIRNTTVAWWDGTVWSSETHGLGGVAALDLVGFDTGSPTLQNLDPGSGDIDVSPHTTITIEAIDTVTGINDARTTYTVNGVNAYLNGVAQSGFSVVRTAITDGYRWVITPDVPLPTMAVTTIGVHVEDNGGNVLSTSYSFTVTDVAAPYLDNLFPAEGVSGIAIDASVMLNVLDDDSGVDPAETKIYLNGVLASSAGITQPGFIVSRETLVSGYGFIVEHLQEFDYGVQQSVRVVAKDLAGNALDRTYTFTTIEFTLDEETEIDIKLGTDHDLELRADGKDLAMVAGLDLVRQRLLITMRMIYGEWFRNREAGTPWFRDVLIQSPKSHIVEAMLRKAILDSWGIESIKTFSMSIVRGTRSAEVNFEAVSTYGLITVSTLL